MLLATIQSLYCIGQFIGIFNSQNHLFRVSGSWLNPNVTAEFLAMSVPVFLFLLQSKFKKMVQPSLYILIIAIVLLKCRSAYIGTLVSGIVFYALQYNFVEWVKNPKNKISRNALLVIAALIVIPFATKLYESKKASADGRLFIWKLSTIMTLQKPVTGYGYGSFSKEYNLFQAKYIEDGKATLEEQTNATPTIMAHNELLQNAVEGGLIGLVLILLFWSSLLFAKREKRSQEVKEDLLLQPIDASDKNNMYHLAYSGVVCFLAMSLFNFSYQAAPVGILFTIYGALICSFSEPLKPISFFHFINNKWIFYFIQILMPIISFYFLYAIINIALADSLNKKALLLKKDGKVNEALTNMPKLEYWLHEESNYWKNYALILFEKKDYNKALNYLLKAKNTSSNPDLYLGSGVCYENLGQYKNAVGEFKQLVFLHPSKFNYRVRLLSSYIQLKDTANVLNVAQSIIDLKPKIPSKKVDYYKKNARKILFAFDKKNKMKKDNMPFVKRKPLYFQN